MNTEVLGPSKEVVVPPQAEDFSLTQEFLEKKAPRLIQRFTEAIEKLPDFQRALSDDFFNYGLTGEVSFRKWQGLYTVKVSENQMVIIKKEVDDVRQGAFERLTINTGDLGENWILFERTKDGEDIQPWLDTEQAYNEALTMLTGLMERMDVITQLGTGEDFPRHGRVQRPHYAYKSTNP